MKSVAFAMCLGCVFCTFVCLVSWVSQVHIATEPYPSPAWVRMDLPIMSLYLSVPGFFTNALSAFYFLVKSAEK